MYPEPHFSREENGRVRDEIRRLGFAADPWVERLQTPVLGLNVAVAWPLPDSIRAPYEALAERLAGLGPEAYVYPHAQTHVTVATLVSFKRHERPDDVTRAQILAHVPAVARVLGDAAAGLAGFELDVGAPVIVRTAAFLPILDRSGTLAAIRQRLAVAFAATLEIQIPNGIHSTALRFRTPPRDAPGYLEAFDAVRTGLGRAFVRELLITTETLPYMMAGQIVHTTYLDMPMRG